MEVCEGTVRRWRPGFLDIAPKGRLVCRPTVAHSCTPTVLPIERMYNEASGLM